MDNISMITTKDIAALINEAAKLQNGGSLQQAEIIYLKVLSEQPDNFKALINMAMLAYAAKDFDKSMAYAVKAMKIEPTNPSSVEVLGAIFLEKKDFDKAVVCFKKTIDMKPSNAMCYSNLAQALHGQKKYDEAIEAVTKALSLSQGNTGILNNLATIYTSTGELEKALDAYVEAFENGGHSINIIYNIALILFFLKKYEELFAFVETVEKGSYLSEFQMIGLNINKAIIYFQNNDLESCRGILSGIKDVKIEGALFPDYDNFKVYYLYLLELVEFRENNPSGYEGESGAELYIIGDSHCLSPAFTFIKIGNKKYKCKSDLIKGAQARHLNGKNIYTELFDKYAESFDRSLRSVPHNSTLVVMFGEIDTRADYGILPYHKKIGKLDKESINQTIENIVNQYVDFCIQKAEEKSLELIFYGVPADNINIEYVAGADREWRRYIIKQFNEELAGAAKERKINFIDVYNMTVNNEGGASDKYYIDATHLKPTAFSEACENYFINNSSEILG